MGAPPRLGLLEWLDIGLQPGDRQARIRRQRVISRNEQGAAASMRTVVVDPRHDARGRVAARIEQARAAWAGGDVVLWGRYGKPSAELARIEAGASDRLRALISVSSAALRLPPDAAWFFDVQVEQRPEPPLPRGKRVSVSLPTLTAALAQFRAAHPDRSYDDAIAAVAEARKAPRARVREAMRALPGGRTRGRPKKPP